ncbi:MAG: ATP-binding protein [Flavobacterium sp.]|nr:ATP-binding protein [Flavobacterium sp.]
MIVEFSVKNFRSIQDLQTISFVATGLKSSEENSNLDDENISDEVGQKLLKTVGIYGANGSGKSNIIKALEYFLRAITNEASTESNLNSLTDPFLFQENANNSESFFQLVFNIENKKYRYGFTVKKNLSYGSSFKKNNETISKEIITYEWLFGTKGQKMGEFFIRKFGEVSKDKLPNKEKIPPHQYEHTLFLTHAAAFDRDGICARIRRFLSGYTISNFKNAFDGFRWNSLFLLEKENRKEEFLELLATFNHSYKDIILDRDANKSEDEILPYENIYFVKQFITKQNAQVAIRLNLGFNESAGTQKIFDIAGVLLRAFNMPMSVLVIIDEVDSNFHPAFLIKLITLFNNKLLNKSNAQLLFTSHDTNLMSPSIMRRDQFYFTEKKEDNSTRLYSLADLKGIRNDADFAKQYLAGFYGALPMLANFSSNKSLEINGGTMES